MCLQMAAAFDLGIWLRSLPLAKRLAHSDPAVMTFANDPSNKTSVAAVPHTHATTEDTDA